MTATPPSKPAPRRRRAAARKTPAAASKSAKKADAGVGAGAAKGSGKSTAKATTPTKVPRRFLALAGNIGAGKTTAAKLVSQAFGYELFDEPVIDNRFLRPYYADMRRWSFTLQLEFLIRRVEHHELIATLSKSCVQDRTLYEDPEVFAKYLHGLGHMSTPELELYFEYFQRLSTTIRAPDKVLYLDVPDLEVLLGRIRTRGRAEEKGIAADFLRGLAGYYASFPMVLKEKYGTDCLVMDVTKHDIRRGKGKQHFLDEVSAFLAS